MTGFDDRERGYEAKFVHDADLRFRSVARRNRLLGEWAAALLGKTGDELGDYASSVVRCDVGGPGDENVFRKLAADLEGQTDQATIRAKIAEFSAEARRQIIDKGR